MCNTQINTVGSEVSDSLPATPSRMLCIHGEGIPCYADTIVDRAIAETIEQAVTTINTVLEPYHAYYHPIKLDFILEEFRNTYKHALRADYCNWEFGASTFLSHVNQFVPVNQKCTVERLIHAIFRHNCIMVTNSLDYFFVIASGLPRTPNRTYSLNLCSVTDVFQTTGQYKHSPGKARPPWLGDDAGRRQLFLFRGTPDFGLNIHNSSAITYFALEELSDEKYAS